MKGKWKESLGLLEPLLLKKEELSDREYEKIVLVEQLFFCGQLLDLKNINEILSSFGIKSSNWYSLLKTLDLRKVKDLTELSLEHLILSQLETIYSKSASTQSRSEVCLIIDDSVFRQWIKDTKYFDTLYFKQYSGQYGKAVYGFGVNTLGISISGVFYPIYFEVLKNNEKSNRIYSAIRLLKRWSKFVTRSSFLKEHLPKIYLSVDSGYDHKELIRYCSSNNIHLICVIRKNNCIEINGDTYKVKQYIEEVFIKEEKVFYENPKNKNKLFTKRLKVRYISKNEIVILLFFRLKGSKKVSVVYSTNLSIFTKTLRRMWFNRTKIEQFFKLLKHTFEWSKARTQSVIDFVKKLYFNFVTAAFVNQFVSNMKKVLSRYDKKYLKIGFDRLRRLIAKENSEYSIRAVLKWLIFRPFASVCDCNKFIINCLSL